MSIVFNGKTIAGAPPQSDTANAAKKADLTSIIATGATNATGATITSGTFFYLNGTLVQALADIASGATFTENTNYEVPSAGSLNALKSALTDWEDISSYITVSSGVVNGRRLGNLVYLSGSAPRITSANTQINFATLSKYKPLNPATATLSFATSDDFGYGFVGVSHVDGSIYVAYNKTTYYGLYFSMLYYTNDL